MHTVMVRYAVANARFAHSYDVDVDGVLFRDSVEDVLRRPNVARWRDLSEAEYCRVRDYVLERTMLELPEPRTRKRSAA